MLRTKFDPNEVVIHEDYAEIVLYGIGNIERARTSIDLDSLPLVEGYKWCIDSDGYAISNSKGKHTKLHRLLTNPPKGAVVDHRDRNKLNNRSYNLLVTNQQKNLINTGMFSHNTSGHKGVTWDKERNKWAAKIKVNGKTINLGRFADIGEAVSARKQAESFYWSD